MRGQVQDNRRSGRATPLAVFLSLAVAVGVVAILVFGVSPSTIAIGAMILLHPLLHFMGGHGHSKAGPDTGDRQGRAQDSHRH